MLGVGFVKVEHIVCTCCSLTGDNSSLEPIKAQMNLLADFPKDPKLNKSMNPKGASAAMRGHAALTNNRPKWPMASIVCQQMGIVLYHPDNKSIFYIGDLINRYDLQGKGHMTEGAS